MSVTTTITTVIDCDEPGCLASISAAGYPEDTRPAAAEVGWFRLPMLDLCPAHDPTRRPTEPA